MALPDRSLPMIVGDFHVVCVSFVPSEAHPPLSVDSNAVQTCPITSECLESIPRYGTNVRQPRCRIEHPHLAHGGTRKVWREVARHDSPQEGFSALVPARLNH